MFFAEHEKAYLLAYTRTPDAQTYPAGLACSLHLAYSRDGKQFYPLNDNYGILFVQGIVSEENTIVPKCMKDPQIFKLEEGVYGVSALRVEEDGSRDAQLGETRLFWTTTDFVTFKEQNAGEDTEKATGKVVSFVQDRICGIPGAVQGCLLGVDLKFADAVRANWSKVRNTQVLLPEEVCVSSLEELAAVNALVVYSDGSTTEKKVDWETGGIDFSTSGKVRVRGQVQNECHPFPLAKGYGDPVLFFWEGNWYFIATNDNMDDVGLYVRKSPNIAGLFVEDAVEYLILDKNEEKGYIQTFWAPEFHLIGGELYILFALGGHVWGPQCYLMRHKSGYDLIDPEGWEEPVRVCRRDGSQLASEGITLDMTYIKGEKASYLVWSYREHIGTKKDTGSMLYIAEADEEHPWQLKSDPVLLSRPLYGWENVSGTINNEGPHGFVSEGRVYLAYSGGAANGYTYTVGMFTADAGDDLLELSSWTKSNTPVLTFCSVAGEYGPGHPSFFRNKDGSLWIAFHAEETMESRIRCDAVRRVHFDVKGRPRFDMSAERDLDPRLTEVMLDVVMKEEIRR